uniref:hypothetical protein n=1 Tax=Dyadobacter sp. MSC1_007 TaxID=2909264 RepID=UPI0020308E79|nr:hypothetical protein [Dyadobacter sp. MSC1_007]
MSTTIVISRHQPLARGYHPAHYSFIATLFHRGRCGPWWILRYGLEEGRLFAAVLLKLKAVGNFS